MTTPIFESLEQSQPTPIVFIATLPQIPFNGRWSQNGTTEAGGNREGSKLNQFCWPHGLHVDEDQTLYIADNSNHRVMEWQHGATSGQVVAGGNGKGNRADQLNCPTDVLLDKQTNSLIICDWNNQRVVQWPRRGQTSGQTIIANVKCWGLAMDDEGFLYVSDNKQHEVRRRRIGETSGTVVAGGTGKGDRLDQLNVPHYVFVDRNHSVYVSDRDNHRVMKWVKGASEGTIVAGGQGEGNALTQLRNPQGVVIDQLGTIYVADRHNHRIMRWPQGTKQGSIVVGGNGGGNRPNQLNCPMGLSFDRQGNLYVVDEWNYRVQRFSIEVTPHG